MNKQTIRRYRNVLNLIDNQNNNRQHVKLSINPTNQLIFPIIIPQKVKTIQSRYHHSHKVSMADNLDRQKNISIHNSDQYNEQITVSYKVLRKKYKNAVKYFMKNRSVTFDQIKCFQQLERHLKNGTQFHDSNPKSRGVYVKASTIFSNQKYKLFDVSGCFLQKTQSRINTLLSQKIQIKDIIQGETGNCYFLSAIASLVFTYPELVFQNYLFMENEAGFYVLKLFVDGQWQYIVTDDRFPCQNGNPVHVKPHGKQIWVMLLEKCWAKIFGSYKATQSGSTNEGFMALTGAPSAFFKTQQYNQYQILQILSYAFHFRHIAAASTLRQFKNLPKQKLDIGLVAGHAYSVLKYVYINGEIVLKLRNPWGYYVWKGDWSFNSNKWTIQLRKKYNYMKDPGDGTFYIPWSAFVCYFAFLTICYINPSFKHSILKLNPSQINTSAHFRISIRQKGSYFFSIYQQNQRKHQYKSYSYSPVYLVLSTQHNIMSSSHIFSDNCTTIKNQLLAGQYLLNVEIVWVGNVYPVVLSSYGCEKVQIRKQNIRYF